jgi:hypothetical protein
MVGSSGSAPSRASIPYDCTPFSSGCKEKFLNFSQNFKDFCHRQPQISENFPDAGKEGAQQHPRGMLPEQKAQAQTCQMRHPQVPLAHAEGQL